MVDTSLNKISDLFTGQMPLGWRFSVFAVIGAIYLAGQFLVLGFVKRKSQEIGAKEKLHLKLIHKMVIIIQCSLTATLLFVVLEMFTLSFYNVGALIVAMAISYILAGFMMGLLARRFFSWFRIRRNFAVLFYGLSSASLAINSVLTLILVSILVLDNPAEILSTHTNSNPAFFYSRFTDGHAQLCVHNFICYVFYSNMGCYCTTFASLFKKVWKSQILGHCQPSVSIFSKPICFLFSKPICFIA